MVRRLEGNVNVKCNLLLKLPTDDIRENLEFAMRMCAEAGFGSDAILVDDAKRSKQLMLAILVPERVDWLIFHAVRRKNAHTMKTRMYGRS